MIVAASFDQPAGVRVGQAGRGLVVRLEEGTDLLTLRLAATVATELLQALQSWAGPRWLLREGRWVPARPGEVGP